MERAGRTAALPRDGPAAMPAIAATAALVIMGDEILAGRVDDINTPFLCRELHALGWQVAKVTDLGLKDPACASPSIFLCHFTESATCSDSLALEVCVTEIWLHHIAEGIFDGV